MLTLRPYSCDIINRGTEKAAKAEDDIVETMLNAGQVPRVPVKGKYPGAKGKLTVKQLFGSDSEESSEDEDDDGQTNNGNGNGNQGNNNGNGNGNQGNNNGNGNGNQGNNNVNVNNQASTSTNNRNVNSSNQGNNNGNGNGNQGNNNGNVNVNSNQGNNNGNFNSNQGNNNGNVNGNDNNTSPFMDPFYINRVRQAAAAAKINHAHVSPTLNSPGMVNSPAFNASNHANTTPAPMPSFNQVVPNNATNNTTTSTGSGPANPNPITATTNNTSSTGTGPATPFTAEQLGNAFMAFMAQMNKK